MHFKGDTVKIVYANYQTAMKNKIVQNLKVDTLVWYTKGKEDYNLYVNDSVKDKTNVVEKDDNTIKFIKKMDENTFSLEGVTYKIINGKFINDKGENVVIINKFNKNGYLYMNNQAYYYSKENDKVEIYNRFGKLQDKETMLFN